MAKRPKLEATPPTPTDPAAQLLQDALNIVTGERRGTYGDPEDAFAVVAALWNAYLGRRRAVTNQAEYQIMPVDVAHLMVLFKIARLADAPLHRDSKLDLAGYAGCAERCAKAAHA